MISVRHMNPNSHKDWGIVIQAVKRAAPPAVEVTQSLLDNIRQALLNKEMAAWMYSNGEPFGIALTSIREDKIMGTSRELFVYCVANLRKVTLNEWDESYRKTRLYALSQGCTHVTAFTVVPWIAEMAERLGGNAGTRYVSIPLGG